MNDNWNLGDGLGNVCKSAMKKLDMQAGNWKTETAQLSMLNRMK